LVIVLHDYAVLVIRLSTIGATGLGPVQDRHLPDRIPANTAKEANDHKLVRRFAKSKESRF
jgi:hypothetical protein